MAQSEPGQRLHRLDEVGHLLDGDVLGREAQRRGAEAADRAGALGVVDRAHESAAHRVLELVAVDVVGAREAGARAGRGQRQRERLARDAEVAGRAVERRERDLLGDRLQAARIAPGSLRARVRTGDGSYEPPPSARYAAGTDAASAAEDASTASVWRAGLTASRAV